MTAFRRSDLRRRVTTFTWQRLFGKPFAVAAVLLSLASAAQAVECGASYDGPEGLTTLHVPVDDRDRLASIYVPRAYSGRHPVPLVLDLHASGITPELELAVTGMDEAAEERGFIVAAPAGATPFPRGGMTWNVPPRADAPDDVAFVEELLDRMLRTYCIDADRVFVTGFSGGARLASELACRLPERLAAISVVGGLRLPEGDETACATGPSVPVLAFHSVDDPINLFDAPADGSPPYWKYGIEEAFERWARRLGCNGSSERTRISARVDRVEATGCNADGELVIYELRGSGHTWPGSGFEFPDFVGSTEPDLDATELTLDWFASHPRRSE